MDIEGARVVHDDTLAIGDVRDPYPVYSSLLARGEVLEVDLREEFGLPIEQTFDRVRTFSVLSYDAVRHAFGETGLSNAIYQHYLGIVTGESILQMDPPEHDGLRRTIASAFRPKSLETWMDDFIRPAAHALMKPVIASGGGELVADLTYQLPMRVICRMLGVPAVDWVVFSRWSQLFLTAAWDPEAAMVVSKEMEDYMHLLIAEKRGNPGDDLTTMLLDASVDDRRLTTSEVTNFLRLLLPAGAETTFRGASIMLLALLTHRDQFEAVRADRALIPAVVDEALRWDPPTHNVPRIAARDVELKGVHIPAGAYVVICPGAANRDPARWQRAEVFDIYRPYLPPATFGHGAHYCLGYQLARLEMIASLEAILDQAPGIRFAPDADDPHVYGMAMRAVSSLPVVV